MCSCVSRVSRAKICLEFHCQSQHYRNCYKRQYVRDKNRDRYEAVLNFVDFTEKDARDRDWHDRDYQHDFLGHFRQGKKLDDYNRGSGNRNKTQK